MGSETFRQGGQHNIVLIAGNKLCAFTRVANISKVRIERFSRQVHEFKTKRNDLKRDISYLAPAPVYNLLSKQLLCR